MKTTFIFSGQGSQYPGMFKDIYDSSKAAKEVFDLCNNALGRKISTLCFNGMQEELNLTHQACKFGRRAIPLQVSAPFHCKLMKPSIPIYFNYTGESADFNIKELLLMQTYSPVQWVKTIEAMYKDGFDTFIECGPGRTLSGFGKKILREKNVSTLRVEDIKTLDYVCKRLGVL